MVGVVGLRGLDAIGGIESHCQELYPRLQALMPDQRFLVTARRGYSSEMTEYRGVAIKVLPVIRHRFLEVISHTLLAILYLRFVARERVVHIHGVGPSLLSPVARLLGMRVVITYHGEDYLREKWGRIAKLALRAGEALAVRNAHELIVVASHVTRRLQRERPANASRIHFIPNGAPPLPAEDDAGDRAILASMHLTPGYVFAVGRLDPGKGFHELIDAHGRCRTDRPLVIAGSAPYEDDYVRSLMAKQSEVVRLVGFQSRERLDALYRNAASFVLPSHHEGLPIAVLEAARFGLPLLLSDIPANREFALDDRHYFPVSDIDALADMLRRDPADFAIDGADMLRPYDWDQIARQTAIVLRRGMMQGAHIVSRDAPTIIDGSRH